MLIFAAIPQSFASDLAGQASVIDGETPEIHGTRIRLWGIDVPESDQRCRAKVVISPKSLMGDHIVDMPLQIGAVVANVTTLPRPVTSVLRRCARARASEAEGSARRTRHA
jgi:hypothetical protein